MTFDQFVLMYSVFCDRAPREMKIHYAFMIYGKLFLNKHCLISIQCPNRWNEDKKNNLFVLTDMDGDGFIGTTDIEHALKLLTQNELSMDEIQCVWEKVHLVKCIMNPIIFPSRCFHTGSSE